MSRTEFKKQTMRDALERAEGLCEGIMQSGERCNANLGKSKYHFDHIIPDAIGGDNSLANCQVLCLVCHKTKTIKIDVPIIAKSKRISDRHLGIRKPSRFPGSRDSGFKRKMNGTVERR